MSRRLSDEALDDLYEFRRDAERDRREMGGTIADENVIDDRLDRELEAAEDDEWDDLLDEED